MKEKSKNKKVLVAVLVILLVVVVFGITYAIFTFTGTGAKVNSISTGVMTMTYTEGENKISITNAMPIEDEVGKKLTNADQVFDFTVETNITGKQSITYEVTGEKDTSSTLSDNDVRLYLEKSEDGTTYEPVLDPTGYTPITEDDQLGAKKGEMILDTGTIQGTTKYYYKLRMWVSKNYNVTSESKFFTVRVNVYGKEGTYDASKEGVLAISKISELAKTDTTNLITDETSDANIRYTGANPNNYVRFNNELWRIVGSFANISNGTTSSKRIKLVKNGYAYTGTAFDSNNSNDYSTSTLKTTLNGTYYNNLSTDAKNMIEDAVWNLGGTPNNKSSTASQFYSAERSSTVYSGHATTWTGKVGLMYPSDYGYATAGGSTTSRASCLAKELYSWDSSSYSDCKNNDYLFDSSHWQWTITPYSGDSYFVFLVRGYGYVSNGSAYYTDSNYGVRPAVFLKSSISISGGSGTETDPYTLSL